jgi:hypothetical protein
MLQASVASSTVPPARAFTRAATKLHTMVAFDLTLPGLDSREPRRVLANSLGNYAQVQLVATDRRHDCVTLRVEVPSAAFPDVIGILTARLCAATIGRVTKFSASR